MSFVVLMRKAIGGNQTPSEAIRGHRRHSMSLNVTQTPSVAITDLAA
jgi:hypothetical protein